MQIFAFISNNQSHRVFKSATTSGYHSFKSGLFWLRNLKNIEIHQNLWFENFHRYKAFSLREQNYVFIMFIQTKYAMATHFSFSNNIFNCDKKVSLRKGEIKMLLNFTFYNNNFIILLIYNHR